MPRGTQDPLHVVLKNKSLSCGRCAQPRSGERALAQEPLEQIRIHAGEWVFDALAAGPAGGELLLMLHGFPQTASAYRAQIPVLAEAGYRVVAPNQRGYSPGARPQGAEHYQLASMVGDVFAMADALGYERFHLLGHDWGGAVAWVTATQGPDRVATLIVLSTPHPAAFAAARSDPNSEQAKRSSYMQDLMAGGAADRLLANDAQLLRRIYAGPAIPPESVDEYLSVFSSPDALVGALNWYRALSLPAPEAPPGPPPKIRVPTVYVWSTEDQAFARESAEASAEYVSGPYEFVVLEGVSHWIPEEAHAEVTDIILRHIGP